jgi:thiol-disulfide isomerase/thioredoxin
MKSVWTSLGLTVAVALGGCQGAVEPGSELEGGPPEVLPATAVELLETVRDGEASATVVNIWATWCQPCIEEFPDLLRLSRDYRERGVRLVLVSADFDDSLPSVKDYLANQGVDFVSYLKKGDDMEFIDRLEPRWSGALPATFIYDSGGSLRDFWEGKASYETMAGRLQAVLGAAGRPPGTEEDS